MLRILSLAALLLSASAAVAGERTVTLAVANMTCAACPIAEISHLAGFPASLKE